MKIQIKQTAAAIAAALVGSIFTTASVRATADEFTVGHSGAAAAYSQYGLTGSGISVGIIDSGVYFCQDASSNRFSADISFVPNNSFQGDQCGHGTHVAGIVAGSGQGSTGMQFTRTFYGIARQAKIANIRVLDQNGQGTVSSVIAGIQWAVKNKVACNIRVINLSLGHPVGESYTTDPLCQAVESAWKAGIVVVCAAGNNGRVQNTLAPTLDNEGYGTKYGSVQSPGNDPYVITVGAMKNIDGIRGNDRVATYSGRGPSRLDFVMKPDIMAPGNKVISLEAGPCPLVTQFGTSNHVPRLAYSTTLTESEDSQRYFVLSGTSMAAPVVAGAAVLMLQKDPLLTPDTIKARLMLSADKWAQPSGTADPCTFGAGYLNIPAALQCTAVPTQSALSPALSQDATGNVLVDANRIIWGTSVTGTRVIWGVNGVSDLRVIWGTQVIWGTSANILSASRIIWGQSVWSDRVIWGTSGSAVDLTSTAIQGE